MTVESDTIVTDDQIIPAKIAAVKMPSLMLQRIRLFNSCVERQYVKEKPEPFSILLRPDDFGKNEEDLQFIKDAGYNLAKSNHTTFYWEVTLPEGE